MRRTQPRQNAKTRTSIPAHAPPKSWRGLSQSLPATVRSTAPCPSPSRDRRRDRHGSLQSLPQLLSRLEESRLHRAFWNLEQGGDFSQIVSFNRSEHDDDAQLL